MLANVLKSEIATQISIRLVKAFVQLRKALSSNVQLHLEIEKIKNYISLQSKKQENQDKNIDLLFQYVDRLQENLDIPVPQERKKIGYVVGKKSGQ